MNNHVYYNVEVIKNAFSAAPCGVGIFAAKTHRTLFLNDAYYQLFGYTEDEYAEMISNEEQKLIFPEDLPIACNGIEQFSKSGHVSNVRFRIVRKSGEIRWAGLGIVPITVGDVACALCFLEDVTDKKKSELLLEFEQHRYQLIVDEMKAAVFEWDTQSGEFYCSDSYKEYAMSNIPPEVILANQGHGDTVHPDDKQAMLKFFADKAGGADRAEAVMRIKLTAGGYRWCRMIGLFYKDESGQATRTIGMIIDIDEEREKSFMLDSLLNELPGGVAVFKVGEELECQYFNDSFAKLSNRTRGELDYVLQSGRLLETVVAPPDLDHFVETIRADTAVGMQINITYRFLTKESKLGWMHMNASKLREEDGYPVYYCVFTRPTEETTLYQSLVEDSSTGVFVAEQKTHRIVYCNKTMRQIYEIAAETDLLGQQLFDIIPQESAFLSDDEISALPTNDYAKYYWQYADRYYSVRAKALLWNRTESYILYLSDETQEHEKRLEQAQLLDQVPVGIGIYEIERGDIRQLYINDNYYSMVGEKRELREKKQGEFLHLVYPDDLTQIYNLAEKCAAGSSKEVIDHRIMCGDGNYKWFRLSAFVVKREGDKTTLYCSYADIDDALKTQKALENANLDLQKQYNQEMAQRKMLERGSMVAVKFNVTKDRLISYRFNEGPVHIYDEGMTGDDIRPGLTENIPTEKEHRASVDFFDRDKALERYQNGTREFYAEFRSRLKNGRLCWLHCTCCLVQDEESGDIISYTYAHDIDIERKKELTADSAIDEETDFVLLLNTVSDSAVLLRLKNDYQGFSDSLYQEFPFDSALGMGEFDIIKEEDKVAVRDFFKEKNLIEGLEKEPIVTITYRHVHVDGTVRRKKTRAFYLDETHEDIVIARRDITDIYEEEQMQKRRLEAALVAATGANRSKSDFLSRMSHDLRTPMNVIIGSASLAMDSINDSEETEKALLNITNSSKYLLGLINDCLDIEKINSGKIELHPAAYPYDDFYNDIKAVIEPLCWQKNITFILDAKETVTPVIVADKMRIEQIFYNLLSNAVKFTPNGGVVEMLTRNIVFEDGIVSYDSIVRDNGIGMNEEFQQHMFEAFAQEENDEEPEQQGTGLGLAIVKQLVDLMNAEITVKSKKNEGTEYRIHFAFPVSKEAVNTAEKSSSVSIDKLKGKRVLMAEDHPLNRMIAQKTLEKAGMIVTAVENGREAVDRFKSVAENFFDAVLMDIRMPVMNGHDATQAIRLLDRLDAKTVPIIAMTANAFETDVEKSIRSGMNEHLSKPIEPEEMYETLAKLIR
ncbi:MAG: PAS domain-containing protein [Eubacteriaceae bacterium]|nr:PAS domain-containing protein [Eubacteriaceae bacterium]